MPILSPKKPVRADHRFIKKVLDIAFEGKVVPLPDELSEVSRVFSDYGGSWERLFNGSTRDVAKLKEVISYALDNGHLTKTEDWI
jgi:hypothetical protein